MEEGIFFLNCGGARVLVFADTSSKSENPQEQTSFAFQLSRYSFFITLPHFLQRVYFSIQNLLIKTKFINPLLRFLLKEAVHQVPCRRPVQRHKPDLWQCTLEALFLSELIY